MKTKHDVFIIVGKTISTGKVSVQGFFSSRSAAEYAIRHASVLWQGTNDPSSLRIVTAPLYTRPNLITMRNYWSSQTDWEFNEDAEDDVQLPL